jgi:hypothetical protein
MKIKKKNALTEAPLFRGASFNLPRDIVDAVDEGRYEDAYDMITNPRYSQLYPGHTAERDLDAVLEDFVGRHLGIREGKDVVKFICKDLGFNESENPFLRYIKDYPDSKNFNKEQWIALNNAYADKIIDPEDLQGFENTKTEGMLLTNDGMWKNNSKADEILKILRAYTTFDRAYKKAFYTFFNANAPEEHKNNEDRLNAFEHYKMKIFFGAGEDVDAYEAMEVLPWSEIQQNLNQFKEEISDVKKGRNVGRIDTTDPSELSKVTGQIQDILSNSNLTPLQQAQLVRSLTGAN